MGIFKKKQEKEIDITSLNDIIRTGRKLINIGYTVAIVCLILLATYILQEWKLFSYLGELLKVISPIFIGFILAWLCVPSVNYIQSKKVPRLVACILVYIVLILFLIILGWAFIPTLFSQVSDFAKSLPDILSELRNFSDGIFRSINNSLINTTDIKARVYEAIEEFATEFSTDLPQKLFNFSKSLISGGVNIILGLMVGFYVLYDFDKINSNIEKIIPKTWKNGYYDLCGRINNSLRNYVQGVLIVMFLVFVTQSVGLTIAGLKAPLLFALFCAITDIIPYFGPYIGAIPAVIVGFTMSPIVGICCIISIIVVQLLENNFYQPIIMGHTMKLHPVTIMLGLLIFEHFFGIIGMIIATPTIACVKVIVMFINEKLGLASKIVVEDN